VEALKSLLLAAALVAATGGCTAAPSTCGDGVDRGLQSTGSCGPDVTVTVKSGSTCVPSAFTGFNSELAGFPSATNDDHPVEALINVADGGRELRRCVLAASGDSGFRVTCERCAADAGPGDAGCSSLGNCAATLLP